MQTGPLLFIALITLILSACGGGGGGGGGGGSSGSNTDNTALIEAVEVNSNRYFPIRDDIAYRYTSSDGVTLTSAFGGYLPTAEGNLLPLVFNDHEEDYFLSLPGSLKYCGFNFPDSISNGKKVYSLTILLDTCPEIFNTAWDKPTDFASQGTGQRWITPGIGKGDLKYLAYTEYLGEKTVSTPAGVFLAKHIRFDIHAQTIIKKKYLFTLNSSMEFWLAERIGIVQLAAGGRLFKLSNIDGNDTDADGLIDLLDDLPENPAETVDTDKDGTGNIADSDDDGDGVNDLSDTFPLDKMETTDTDQDGIGNNADMDDDNDQTPDILDRFPLDASEHNDFDQDNIGDNADIDDDNDTVPDINDDFPYNINEDTDTDHDGTGNNADTDDDNDSIADTEDDYPLDTDNDGSDNNIDADDDNDGTPDDNDTFPLNPAESSDNDKDGIGDNNDTDDDNDGTPDINDALPFNPAETLDNDRDGIGNWSDTDDDNDGVIDFMDPLPFDPNESVDTDGDGIGNNADTNDDNDRVNDLDDAFPLDYREQYDTDNDGIGNNADIDDDNDGVNDNVDAFPLNPDETVDTDKDKIGNNADKDDDNDGVADDLDAFPTDYRESRDTDNDGIGNNADTDDDNDGVADNVDTFPLDASETTDTDKDGIGNNADSDDDNDGFADANDPAPLDNQIPGEVYSVSPGIIVNNQLTRVIIHGKNLTPDYTYSINGIVAEAVFINPSAVELSVEMPAEGSYNIDYHIGGFDYQSRAKIRAISPRYYPYATIHTGGKKTKGYFDQEREAFYELNSNHSEITRYQYTTNGEWAISSLTIPSMTDFALSSDKSKMLATKQLRTIVEIDPDTFTTGESFVYIPEHGAPQYLFSGIAFDYANTATVITSPGSEQQLIQFGTESGTSNYHQYYNAPDCAYQSNAMASSGDGRLILLGFNNYLSAEQEFCLFDTTSSTYQNIPFSTTYISADIDRKGEKILVNNQYLLDGDLQILGEIDTNYPLTASAVDQQGQFIVGATADLQLHWFDTRYGSAGILTPDYSAAILDNVGTINEMVLSDDGYTLFVLGSNKTLVIPVWQIVENAVGSTATCPMSGCTTGNIASGKDLPPPDIVTPVDANDEPSPATYVSPTYAESGHRMEVLVTGQGFGKNSIVQFNDIPADQVRFVSTNELRVKLPALPPGAYSVLVDGRSGNAPLFTALEQADITANFWSLPGTKRKLIYDAKANVLYGLALPTFSVIDTEDTYDIIQEGEYYLFRIDLDSNTVITRTLLGASDITWCPAKGTIYMVNEKVVKPLQMFAAEDLADIGVFDPYINILAGASIECIAENKLIFISHYASAGVQLLDLDIRKLKRIYTSTASTNLFERMLIDGVASIGDRVYVGISNTEGNRGMMLMPYLDIYSLDYQNTSTYTGSSWSADRSLSVFNGSDVYNRYMSQVAKLPITGTAAISPKGDRIYVARDNVISLVTIAADGLSPVVTATHTITEDIGTIQRAVTSLDGLTVFVAGSNGIVSVRF